MSLRLLCMTAPRASCRVPAKSQPGPNSQTSMRCELEKKSHLSGPKTVPKTLPKVSKEGNGEPLPPPMLCRCWSAHNPVSLDLPTQPRRLLEKGGPQGWSGQQKDHAKTTRLDPTKDEEEACSPKPTISKINHPLSKLVRGLHATVSDEN